MRTSSALLAIALGALAVAPLFVAAGEALGGVKAPVGSVTFSGTGPVSGGTGPWTGTATGNDITIEGWGYWGSWDEKDGSYVGPPRLYLNADGTYNLINANGQNIGSGTWSHP